ncbi:hypothetical protein DFJ73DRAFT_778948, partial [Zopfochytrium polystomum]
PFRVAVDLDYDSRRRDPRLRAAAAAATVSAQQPVGFRSLVGTLATPKSGGVRLAATPFWALARTLKREADAALGSFTRHRLLEMILHRTMTADTPDGAVPAAPSSVVGDVNVSNLGRYRFAESHQLPAHLAAAGVGDGGGDGDGGAAEQVGGGNQKTTVTIESLHLLNGLPFIGYGGILFVAGAAGKLHFSLVYRWSDEHAAAYMDKFTRLMDAVGTVTASETVHGFATRVLGHGAKVDAGEI